MWAENPSVDAGTGSNAASLVHELLSLVAAAVGKTPR